jgi:hypothetical protein
MEQRPEADDDLESPSLDALLGHRSSPWRRARRIISLVAVLALVAGLLLRQTRPTHSTPSIDSSSVIPVQTLILSNTSWGTLTADGVPVTTNQPQRTITLSKATTITLDAAPFAPRTCHVAPASVNGTPTAVVLDGPCSSVQVATSLDGSPRQGQLSAGVFFALGGNDLPTGLATSARQEIARELSALQLRTTIPAGDYYAVGRDSVGHALSQRATTTLAATLDVVPDPRPDQNNPSCGDPDCGPASPLTIAGMDLWSVREGASLRWRFFDDAGQQIGNAGYRLSGLLPMMLTYDGAGGWQKYTSMVTTAVSPGPQPDDLCGVGQDLLGLYENTLPGAATVRGVEKMGCAFEQHSADGTPVGLFVWRYGVLLAGDAQAHTLISSLPVAPPDEVAAALHGQGS